MSDPKPFRNVADRCIVASAIVLAGAGLCSTWAWDEKTVASSWKCGSAFVSGGTIALVDLYLFSLMWFSAWRSEKYRPFGPIVSRSIHIFPTRPAAVLAVPLLATALISSYAAIYELMPGCFNTRIESHVDALYSSFVVMSTVGFGDYVPVTKVAKIVVMTQLGSLILLFTCAFSFLISRLSSFEDEP